MSSEVSANQQMKVRYNRKVEEEGVYEEREVIIYDNADCIREPLNNFQSKEGVSAGPQTQNHRPVHRKSFRGAAVCLGVLCFLMAAGIVFLAIQYFSVPIDKEQLQTRFNDQLQQLQGEVKVNNSRLEDDLKKLKIKITVNISELQNEIKQLKNKTKECPEGWRSFGCSCYFKSTEKKKWSESRSNCQERGSDLVMINSKEEQDFVTKLNKNEESWIGLRTTENKTSSTGYRWEWVDDSLPTETFWATAELENPTSWFAAVCCDQRGKWTRSGYNKNHDTTERNWICEK